MLPCVVVYLLLLLGFVMGSVDKMKGYCLTSYSAEGYLSEESDAGIANLKSIGVEFVEVMATWYTDNSVNATEVKPLENKSPTKEAIVHAINTAKSLGLKIVMKPHIDPNDGQWRAYIGTHFTTDQQWQDFFASYTNYMLWWIDIVNEVGGVDGFDVGTELDGTHARETEWRQVIATVRSQLPNTPLWIGPNWSWNGKWGYEFINFWDALDYLAVDMYSPIYSINDPTLEQALQGWTPIISAMTSFAAVNGNKKIVFAESGYASVPYAAVTPYACCTGESDVQTQALLYEAFFQGAWTQPWMAGYFPWAWPDQLSADARVNQTSFDIWGKPAVAVFQKYYLNDSQPEIAVS
eukprot:TRINITY_DN1332_c0_g1_i1.p1 TRINITY_DN1332_c0_g1~~TRINITY_DN1332_c0_g1_i1.p1  ORF type:complete len:351 (-),score=95.60 TRINITY_DN1332_c0_g1_i1:471-1523(-)